MHFRNKTVLLIIHQAYLGGAERQALSTSKVLTEKYDCKVYLLLTYSSKVTQEFRDYANQCNIKKILFFGDPYFLVKREFTYRNLKRFVWSLKYIWKLRQGVKVLKPDVIIPFLNFPSKISYYLYKLLPTVKNTFWHQLGLDSWSNDILEEVAAKNIPLVLANASNGLEIFTEKYSRSEEDLFLLPQFTSLDYVSLDVSNLKESLNISPDTIVIGMIAHYRPEKLHYLLVDAFVKLERDFSNIVLVFLGNQQGKTIDQLKKIICILDLEHKILVLSNIPVIHVLNLMDVGVLVSEIEGVPNAVMEYMLYGLPVVCTNHPGCEVLLGDSSFLIKNNIEQLYHGLKELLMSKDLRFTEGAKNLQGIKSFDEVSYIENLQMILSRTNMTIKNPIN